MDVTEPGLAGPKHKRRRKNRHQMDSMDVTDHKVESDHTGSKVCKSTARASNMRNQPKGSKGPKGVFTGNIGNGDALATTAVAQGHLL